MAGYIQCSELVRYNANNRGNRVGDCVKRSISFAFDKSYIKVSQDLNALLNGEFKSLKSLGYSWNNSRIYPTLIKRYGGSDAITLPKRITLDEFADANPSGTFLAVTAKTDSSRSDHIVCVLDGKIYDSWDSRSQYVVKYYECNHVHAELTDIRSHLTELGLEAVDCVQKELAKLFKKYGWDEEGKYYVDDEFFSNNYSIKLTFSVRVPYPGSSKQLNQFIFDITYVFTPTTSIEEAHKIVINTSKVRVYDRLYALNQKIQSAEEEELARSEAISEGHSPKNHIYSFWNDQERKFYESLPGWVRGRLRYINVQYPGQYNDSYELDIYPIANHISPEGTPSIDEYLTHSGCLKFTAYNAADIKDMLNRYKTKGEIPDRDYSIYEEY